MGRIYSLAEKTVVWLGKENYQLALGLKAILCLHLIGDTDSSSRNIEVERKLFSSPFYVPEIFWLLQNPYFTRVWIVQEIALSPNLEIRFGQHCVPFGTLALPSTQKWLAGVGNRSARMLLNILAIRCHVFKNYAETLGNPR